MHSVFDSGNGTIFGVLKAVLTAGNFCNLVNVLISQQGKSILGYNPLNKILLQVPFVAILMLILFTVALIIGIVGSVRVAVHTFPAMPAKHFSREQINVMGFVPAWSIFILFHS